MRLLLYRAKTLLSKKEALTLTTRVVINNDKKKLEGVLNIQHKTLLNDSWL